MRMGKMPTLEKQTTPQFWIRGVREQVANREEWREDVWQVVWRAGTRRAVKKFNGDFCAGVVREFAQRLRGWPQRLSFYRSHTSQW